LSGLQSGVSYSLPVGRVVLLADLDRAVERGVGALLELPGVVVGRRAVDPDDLTLIDAAVLDELVQQGGSLQLADSLVVEGHEVVELSVVDQRVVGDDSGVPCFGAVGDRRRGLGVHRRDDQHVGALGQRRLGLLDLTIGVLVGVVHELTLGADEPQRSVK
jgi:hypothetical protein